MERYRRRDELEFVHHVFNSLPEQIKELLQETQFVTGYSPSFLGLHFGTPDFFSRVSHCDYNFNQKHFSADYRRTTIVLANKDAFKRTTVLHELGHVLHWELIKRRYGESSYNPLFTAPSVIPLTEYAKKNNLEAFATAFQAWMTGRTKKLVQNYTIEAWGYTTKTDLLERDPATYHFFEKLKRGE